jgi:hypothetical protein
MDIIDRLNKCRRSLKTWPPRERRLLQPPDRRSVYSVAPRDVGLRLACLQPRDSLFPLTGR